MKTVFLHFSNYPPCSISLIAAAVGNLVFMELPRFLLFLTLMHLLYPRQNGGREMDATLVRLYMYVCVCTPFHPSCPCRNLSGTKKASIIVIVFWPSAHIKSDFQVCPYKLNTGLFFEDALKSGNSNMAATQTL